MIRTLYSLGSPADRRRLVLVLTLIGISAVALAIGLILIALFLDTLFSEDPAQAAAWLPWIIISVLVYAAADWPTEVIAQDLGHDYVLRIHRLIADRTAQLPLGYFEEDRAGQIGVVATSGALFAANAPAMMLRPMLHGAASAGLACVFLIAVDWRLGLVTVAVAAVVWFAYNRLMRQYRVAERQKGERNEHGAAEVLEFAQVQPVLRMAGPDSLGERAVRASIREQLSAQQHTQKTGEMIMGRLALIIMVGTVVIDALATVLLLNHWLEAGTYIGVIVLVFILARVAMSGIPYGEGLESARNTLDEIQKILDARVLPEPAVPAAPRDYSIEFDGVGFGYEPNTPVVRDVSFRVAPGTTTALVGPSGCGKSTLLKLAARFYDVDQGTIRIGGVDIRDLGSRAVLDSLAMVFQYVYLFEDTLYENIRLGCHNATREEVLRAAELAGVTEIARQLPQGFDTLISEGGQNLSGGERQRVSIARALLKDARIVLLDEATSSLDVQNEHLVMRGMKTLSAERTIVVIAHRLHTIRDADQIVMMSPSGTVESIGNHEELMESSPRYRSFWGEKSDATSWKL
ncbi:ABC transporter ATP-binding protein [Corynebacterium diphtheriae]|uniref:ABC transporter ATP-binding protein n=1 Tax=Corynebacterium diphtheriae TaxID=1717 RepID=UPI00092ACFF7|nr:ABC transporter ATP-binding protein [Corynebacterium diphtheriae]OJI01045.1 ATP-binding protein [Corynebacterium diphtheriae]OSQ07873.1 ATP-binding protein [Corynebacterium diphtheriae]